MRILYLMDQFYLHGGGEKILSLKINELVRQHEVVLLTSGQKGKTLVYPLDSRVLLEDLGVDYVEGKSYFGAENLRKSLRHFFLLKKAIARIKPDIIVSVSNSPDQYFLPILSGKARIVKEFHSSRFRLRPGRFKAMLEKQFDRYDALVALNETEKTYFPAHNTVVIPNFTDLEPIVGISREKTVIAAGRIAPVKQFDQLLKAWKLISADFPDWTLKIFGDGDAEPLKALIKGLALSSSAKLAGAVPNLNMEMQKASLYAMTSETECFPMVLLEAQAAGVPVVSYDCPNGPRNILTQGEDGLLVPQNDIGALAQSLGRLMQDEPMRQAFSIKARQNAARFSRESVMQKWNDLFTSLCR